LVFTFQTERFGVHIPDRAAIAQFATSGRFPHGLPVVEILFRLGEHEQVLMRAGGTILDALRHGVRFVPHDVATQIPAIVLQGEGKSPRYANQILGLQALRCVGADIHGPCRIFLVGCPPATVAAGVTIADVEPERAVGCEDALGLLENRD
jgi:hypothetical protein